MGEWIKMRVAIDRDPKVLSMATHLAEDKAFCQWLGHPVQVEIGHAWDHVSVTVTRDIVVASLLRFWGVAIERGKRDGDDLTLSRCNFFIIDEITGVPGFGRALEHVGWVACEENDSVRLPQFLVDNKPVDERKKETQREQSRESSRRYREKKKDNTSVTRDDDVTVTRDAKVTLRGEEIREDNKKKNKQKKKASVPGEYSPAFEEFWEAYPRREGKGNAWSAWVKSLALAANSAKRSGDESVEEFLARRARDYAAFTSTKDREFIRLPATWLNGGNWDDETGSRVATLEDLKAWRPE